MKKMKANGRIYNNVYCDSNCVIKYSPVEIKAWETLFDKHLSFLNYPFKYIDLDNEEKNIYGNCHSKIYLPFLSGYETMYNSKVLNNCDSKDILLLLKKMLLLLKKMHKKSIYHGDIYSENIMINDKLDVNFIDLDLAIIHNYISESNIYVDDEIDDELKKIYTMNDDKKGIFYLFMYYFAYGNFKQDVEEYVDITRLGLSDNLTNEILSYQNGRIIGKEYYFLDIVDELINIGYEPKKKTK